MTRLFAAALALLLPVALFAQPRCTKGKPCGNSCIAVSKTCRIGTPAARPAPPPAQAPTSPPAQAQPLAVGAVEVPERDVRPGSGVEIVLPGNRFSAMLSVVDQAGNRWMVQEYRSGPANMVFLVFVGRTEVRWRYPVPADWASVDRSGLLGYLDGSTVRWTAPK